MTEQRKAKNLPANAIIDPSLIDYLKHIHGNRKQFIQFSFKKIEEIIKTELKIDLSERSELTRRVTVQCFAYFLKTWPEWNAFSKRLIPHVEGYMSLKIFLRRKLLQTKEKEHAYNIPLKYNETELPDHAIPELPNDMNIELPYKLTITAPPDLLPDLQFTHVNESDMAVEFNQRTSTLPRVNTKSLVEYPFVSIEFHLPGIVKIQRNCCTKIERYIQKADMQLDNDTETIVENVSPTAKVYTLNFFKNFFAELQMIIDNLNKPSLYLIKAGIQAFWNAFLNDIFDSDLCDKTVCEGAQVTFDVGKSKYYSNTKIHQSTSDSSDDRLVYRKIVTHMVSYCLVCCSIKQEDVQKDGLSCFASIRNKEKGAQDTFLKMIKSCMTYKCLFCNLQLDNTNYKSHFANSHPLDECMNCTKCQKAFILGSLLRTRWRHFCNLEVK